jgi:hypothetical protein
MFNSVIYTYGTSYHEIQYGTQVVSFSSNLAQVGKIKSKFHVSVRCFVFVDMFCHMTSVMCHPCLIVPLFFSFSLFPFSPSPLALRENPKSNSHFESFISSLRASE